MTDYTKTFGDIFTTRHKLTAEELNPVIHALDAEIGENLVYDHWHPEIAGSLQMAVHYLQTRNLTPPKNNE